MQQVLFSVILCCSRKYLYLPQGRLFDPPPPPTRIPNKLEISVPFKNLAFETPPPPPFRISSDLPWGGYGYFLEPYITGWFKNLISDLLCSNCHAKKTKQVELQMREVWSGLTVPFNNKRNLKFISPPTVAFFTAINRNLNICTLAINGTLKNRNLQK